MPFLHIVSHLQKRSHYCYSPLYPFTSYIRSYPSSKNIHPSLGMLWGRTLIVGSHTDNKGLKDWLDGLQVASATPVSSFLLRNPNLAPCFPTAQCSPHFGNKSHFIIRCWVVFWLCISLLPLTPQLCALMSSDTMRECNPVTLMHYTPRTIFQAH